MIGPKNYFDEELRISELKALDILDSEEEKDFNDIVQLASIICEAPISLVSLVDTDRQWFKASVGIAVKETPRDISFCGHAINEDSKFFMIEDAREDNRFHDNPLVTNQPNVVFYAGVVLETKNNLPIGTLCVIDDKPKQLTDVQINALKTLSKNVSNLIELRRKTKELTKLNDELDHKNKELDSYAYTVAHDLRSPLVGLAQMLELLKNEILPAEKPIVKEIVEFTQAGTNQLLTLVNELLERTKHRISDGNQYEEVDLSSFLGELTSIFSLHQTATFKFDLKHSKIRIPRILLKQIILNLVSNSIKHNSDRKVEVLIKIKTIQDYHQIEILDNGKGVEESERSNIFKLNNNSVDCEQLNKGYGLYYIKSQLEEIGGQIYLEPTTNTGAHFVVRIPY